MAKALYFLSYDVSDKKDYSGLYKELEKINAKKILQSTYCFKDEEGLSVELCNFFRDCINNDGGVVVSEILDCASLDTENEPEILLEEILRN